MRLVVKSPQGGKGDKQRSKLYAKIYVQFTDLGMDNLKGKAQFSPTGTVLMVWSLDVVYFSFR